jgi:hypothetical protein
MDDIRLNKRTVMSGGPKARNGMRQVFTLPMIAPGTSLMSADVRTMLLAPSQPTMYCAAICTFPSVCLSRNSATRASGSTFWHSRPDRTVIKGCSMHFCLSHASKALCVVR